MQNKTYNINSPEDIQKILRSRKIESAKGDRVEVFVNLKSYSPQTMDKLAELAMKMRWLNSEPIFHFNIEDFNLDQKDYGLITDFHVEMKKLEVETDFYDLASRYTIEQGVDAFFNAEKFINAVKALDLSPLEIHFLICMHLSSFQYQENEEHRRKARTIVNVLTGTDIVCLGYAELASYLHKRLGIKSVVQILSVYDKQGKSDGTHANNLVFIDDKKYKYKGWGYSDITWDSKDKNEEPFLRYLFSFIPLSDKNYFAKENLEVQERALNALYGGEEKELLIEDMLFDVQTAMDAFLDFGLEDEYAKIEAEMKDDSNFIKKKKRACKLLKQFLKENNVRKDVYKDANGMPAESSLDFLIAEFMQDDIDFALTKLSLDGFKSYENRRESFETMAKEYGVESICVDDYEQTLETIMESAKHDVDDEIKANYISIKCSALLSKLFKEPINVPLPIEVIKEILTNIYRKMGANEKFIAYQVNKIIELNIRRADKTFLEGATNSFKKQALLRRDKEC